MEYRRTFATFRPLAAVIVVAGAFLMAQNRASGEECLVWKEPGCCSLVTEFEVVCSPTFRCTGIVIQNDRVGTFLLLELEEGWDPPIPSQIEGEGLCRFRKAYCGTPTCTYDPPDTITVRSCFDYAEPTTPPNCNET